VTCADDIELMDCEGDLEFTAEGFTALGHPSPLEIGTTHGVFILDATSKTMAADMKQPCSRGVCTRFTHKPSVETMKTLGANIPGSDLVYTDSAYYFDRATSQKLQAFYTKHAPLSSEIDAYGDFLQALGPQATDEYTRDSKNVIVADGGLAEMRLKLYTHLQNTPLHVILCNVSKFYHIGTVPEFLFHYCTDISFRGETSALHAACVAGGGEAKADGYTAIHSLLSGGATIGIQTVVEYSDVGAGVVVGSRCLVSCTTLVPPAVVPDETFLHTTKIKAGFVTIVFSTAEDLKTGAQFVDVGNKLTYCGAPLSGALSRLGCIASDLWENQEAKCTLWNARVFPCFDTIAESVAYAITVATAARAGGDSVLEPPLSSLKRLHMEEILADKDLEAIMAGREALRQAIAAV
jgi:fucose-1-phosphate guanylyltransferase